jgi:hypothetical protein
MTLSENFVLVFGFELFLNFRGLGRDKKEIYHTCRREHD